MRVVSYSEFSNHLTQNLNTVNDEREIVVVSRTKGKNVVMMDLEDYNSILETLHLVSTKANRKRLDDAIEEMNSGISFKHNLLED